MKEIELTRFLATELMDMGEGPPGSMTSIDGSWYLPEVSFISWFRPIHEIAHAFMLVDEIVDKGWLRISNGDGDSRDFDFLPNGWPSTLKLNRVNITEDEDYPFPKLISLGIFRALATDEQQKEMGL